MAGIIYVPLISATVSGASSIYLVMLFLRLRKLHYLLFAFMMVDMLAGQLLEFYSGFIGWNEVLYKIYYFTSPLSPALGALGVLSLLGWRRALAAFGIYTIIAAAILAYGVAQAAISSTELGKGPYVGGSAMEEFVRRLSPPLTIPGGLVLLAGSVMAFRRLSRYSHLVIAMGALVFMIAGGLLRHGYGVEFLVLEMIGTTLLAYAFIKS